MTRIIALSVLMLMIVLPAQRVKCAAEEFDVTVPPGANYDKADFRLSYPLVRPRCEQ
jgi:hypothetical protein